MLPDSFETLRLLLHRIGEADHAFMLELVNTEGWLKFIGDRKVHSEDEAKNYIRRIMQTPDLYYWVVTIKETNTPAGIISFLKRDYLDHFDIGFAFLPAYYGKSYAFETASMVLNTALKFPQYKTILATTLPDNARSVRVLERLGMKFLQDIDVKGEMLKVYCTGKST